MKRRTFVYQSALTTAAFSGLGITACNSKTKQVTTQAVKKVVETTEMFQPFFKLSLAQWSLNRNIFAGKLSPFAFAAKAKELGFDGLEYVSGLYKNEYEEAENQLQAIKNITKKLNAKASEFGVESLLIMIDGEGDLGSSDKAIRKQAAENHHKWVDAANALGCHSIRVNLFGDGTKEAQLEQASDGLGQLCAYGKDQNINVIVENHGGYSSDPKWLTGVMKNVNMPNCGTLPDFGNFCIAREGGAKWGAPCINEYEDYYGAVKMMMPYAKAVSAKSYNFNAAGDETKIDYYKMLQVIKDADYNGYIGVEFEGEADEEEGILATKNLLIKAAKKVQ